MKKFLVIVPGEDCFHEVEEYDLPTLKHQFEVVEPQQLDNTILFYRDRQTVDNTNRHFEQHITERISNCISLKNKYKECVGWLDSAKIGERLIIELSKFTPTLVVRIK